MGIPRVVITGIGIVSPIGNTAEEFGASLFDGRTCVGTIESFEVADKRYCLGGELKEFDIHREMPRADTKRMMRYSHLALVAADRAIRDARLDLTAINVDRCGTSFGTAAGALPEGTHTEIRRYFSRGDHGVSPAAWGEFTPGAITAHVAIHFGLRGPSATHSSGCVTGLDTVLWGRDQIRNGHADVVVVGGADAPFFPFMWAMMCRSGILAQCTDGDCRQPRPFSADHNGIVLTEGGASLVLEAETHARLRGAPIYGELLGIVSTEEARPITALDQTGTAFAVTIEQVLHEAGLPPKAIDWICAHGTGFPIADLAESNGIETALGEHAFCVPVSSIRGAIGQSFASGGGFQLTAACMAIKHQRVPPTINFTAPAPGCRLDYVPNRSRVARVHRVLVNAAGVGGTHGAAVIGRYTP